MKTKTQTQIQPSVAGSTQASHTPIPWSANVKGTPKAPDWIAIFNSTGKWALATLSWPAGIERAEVEANADLIVRAVNSHAELVAALELAQATIERLTVRRGPFSSTDGTQDVIRAALANATKPGGNAP